MRLLEEIAQIGRDPGSGGYLRFAWTEPELRLRDWFREQAASRGLTLEEDGNGNLFAWTDDGLAMPRGAAHEPGTTGTIPAAARRGSAAQNHGLAMPRGAAHEPGTTGTIPAAARRGSAAQNDKSDAVLTGSHFDSVPHGGAFDGPLGIVSAFLAVDLLRERGAVPRRPIGIAAFAEEEGSRFGLACLGSRLLTGAVDPSIRLVDRDGVALQDVIEPAGRRQDILDRIGCFVELHIEQGRALQRPVGVGSSIWPHGRWRFDFTGEPNHAGTTLMADRRDPMLTFAFTVLAANKEARLRHAHATMGRVAVTPNATNAIAASVSSWLDARAATPEVVEELVKAVETKAIERAMRDGTSVTVTAESVSPETVFHTELRDRLAALLDDAPILPTGAGHDAGVLSAHVPTAMLFVRNPTGVSHSPAEFATDDDCEAGVTALADVLQDLAC